MHGCYTNICAYNHTYKYLHIHLCTYEYILSVCMCAIFNFLCDYMRVYVFKVTLWGCKYCMYTHVYRKYISRRIMFFWVILKCGKYYFQFTSSKPKRTSPSVFEISIWNFVHGFFSSKNYSFVTTADIGLL